jgi:hypothetical protein
MPQDYRVVVPYDSEDEVYYSAEDFIERFFDF